MDHATIFASLARTSEGARRARLWIAGLRAFGGSLQNAPVWVYTPDPAKLEAAFEGLEGVQTLALEAPAEPQAYPFLEKVQACAQAEALAGPQVTSLVWMDPNCLVINPPELLRLSGSERAAFRVVHHRNVGSPAMEPPDAYWQRVYDELGEPSREFTLTSYVDERVIRPYFNTHLFAVNPRLGLCREWQGVFERLSADQAFQEGACREPLKRIFLHQAVFSTLVAVRLDRLQLRLLPPVYSYPLHMHTQLPADRQVARLEDLVCPVYEEQLPDFAQLGMSVEPALQAWLEEHAAWGTAQAG